MPANYHLNEIFHAIKENIHNIDKIQALLEQLATELRKGIQNGLLTKAQKSTLETFEDALRYLQPSESQDDVLAKINYARQFVQKVLDLHSLHKRNQIRLSHPNAFYVPADILDEAKNYSCEKEAIYEIGDDYELLIFDRKRLLIKSDTNFVGKGGSGQVQVAKNIDAPFGSQDEFVALKAGKVSLKEKKFTCAFNQLYYTDGNINGHSHLATFLRGNVISVAARKPGIAPQIQGFTPLAELLTEQSNNNNNEDLLLNFNDLIQYSLDVFFNAFKGIIELNEKKIVHADIQFPNILVNQQHEVTYIDFGRSYESKDNLDDFVSIVDLLCTQLDFKGCMEILLNEYFHSQYAQTAIVDLMVKCNTCLAEGIELSEEQLARIKIDPQVIDDGVVLRFKCDTFYVSEELTNAVAACKKAPIHAAELLDLYKKYGRTFEDLIFVHTIIAVCAYYNSSKREEYDLKKFYQSVIASMKRVTELFKIYKGLDLSLASTAEIEQYIQLTLKYKAHLQPDEIKISVAQQPVDTSQKTIDEIGLMLFQVIEVTAKSHPFFKQCTFNLIQQIDVLCDFDWSNVDLSKIDFNFRALMQSEQFYALIPQTVEQTIDSQLLILLTIPNLTNLRVALVEAIKLEPKFFTDLQRAIDSVDKLIEVLTIIEGIDIAKATKAEVKQFCDLLNKYQNHFKPSDICVMEKGRLVTGIYTSMMSLIHTLSHYELPKMAVSNQHRQFANANKTIDLQNNNDNAVEHTRLSNQN